MKKTNTAEILHALICEKAIGTQSMQSVTEIEPEICHGDQFQVHAYIEAELENQNAAALYPALHKHIAECCLCQSAYQELKELLELEKADALLEPPCEAHFDLSYLDADPDLSQRAAPVLATR